MNKMLIATDLDRTILPNGEHEESIGARDKFRILAERPEVTLAYVSGRNKDLLQNAIQEYALPVPDYAIGDVGTTIYTVGEEKLWTKLAAWEDAIASDWNGYTWEDITKLYEDISAIRLQDNPEISQNTFKASYFTDTKVNRDELLAKMYARAKAKNINLSIIFSIDEEKQVGLLDILPKKATKLHALQFLMKSLDFKEENTVFCGDSGNDIPALTSGLQAVLVKNAREDIKEEVKHMVERLGILDQLYIAKGNFLGMNGNYSAGVMEGIANFLPHTKDWITE